MITNTNLASWLGSAFCPGLEQVPQNCSKRVQDTRAASVLFEESGVRQTRRRIRFVFLPWSPLPKEKPSQKVLELPATSSVLPTYSKLLLGSTARWSAESASLVERDKDSKPGPGSDWKADPPPRGAPGLLEGRVTEKRSGLWPLGRSDSLGLSEPQLSAEAKGLQGTCLPLWVPLTRGVLSLPPPSPSRPYRSNLESPWPRKYG